MEPMRQAPSRVKSGRNRKLGFLVRNIGERPFVKWTKTFFILAFCATLPWGWASGAQPSSHGSQLVHDLKATRKGNKVMLTWSQPRALLDRQPVMGHLLSRVCRNISAA